MLSGFTAFHVTISLIAIVTGFIVLYGFLTSQPLDTWNRVFLTFTTATSVTGFMFPFNGFTPGDALGIISLVVLTVAVLARYRFALENGWGKTYVVTAIIALYLNVFVLIVQSFEKIPALHSLAPTQTESPFKAVQLVVLLVFIGLGVKATTGFETGRRRV